MFGRPWEVLRILRAADHEAALGPASRRFDKQPFDRRLAVGGVGAEIGEIAGERRMGRCRPVMRGVDVTVKRCDAARTEPALQRRQCGAAGIAQHQIEARRARRGPI